MLWGHGRARQRNISILRVAFSLTEYLEGSLWDRPVRILRVCLATVAISLGNRPAGHVTHVVESLRSAPAGHVTHFVGSWTSGAPEEHHHDSRCLLLLL